MVRDLLVRGRERVARGHAKSILYDAATDSYCMVGAIVIDEVGQDGYTTFAANRTVEEAYALLAEAIGVSPNFPLPVWNNAPERTPEEVVDAFDRAIELFDSAHEAAKPELALA